MDLEALTTSPMTSPTSSSKSCSVAENPMQFHVVNHVEKGLAKLEIRRQTEVGLNVMMFEF